MKAVGVKALKAKLSEYLRLVKGGETVLVTEHDEVIAELRPAHHQRLAERGLTEGLEGWAEQGHAILRVSESSDLIPPHEIPPMTSVSSQEVLDQLRKESR